MQQAYQCPNCRVTVPFGVKFCANCGIPLNWPTQQQMQPRPVYQEQQQPRGWAQQPVPVQNTSGQGRGAAIPPEIKGWNWGAFLLTWIWGIGNRVWLAFLVFLPIPLAAFAMSIVLGVKGSEWAWQTRKWDSVERFKRTQRTWTYWGIGILCLSLLLTVAVAIAIVGYRNRGGMIWDM